MTDFFFHDQSPQKLCGQAGIQTRLLDLLSDVLVTVLLGLAKGVGLCMIRLFRYKAVSRLNLFFYLGCEVLFTAAVYFPPTSTMLINTFIL